jgi:hypothetical protein
MNGQSLNFDWDEANQDHLARHGVTPHEAEEVVLGDPLDIELQTAKVAAKKSGYYTLGKRAKDGFCSLYQRGAMEKFESSPRGMRLGNPSWTIWPK